MFFPQELWLEMMIRLAGSQTFMGFFRQSKAMNHRPTDLRYTKPTAIMGDSPICYRDLLPSTVGKSIFQGHVVSPVKASTLHEANHPTPSPYRCPTSVVTSLRFRLVQSQSEGLSAGEITGATTTWLLCWVFRITLGT